MKNMKRIHKVVIKRMVDESPDTSWLGEYSNRATNEFSIDREHDADCPRFWANDDIPDDARDCDCSGSRDRGTYQYFNPGSVESFNENASWIPKDAPYKRVYWRSTMLENALKDYARSEAMNAGEFCFIGIRADAEYSVPRLANDGKPSNLGYLAQEMTSGGLWGIESDSSPEYLKEIEQEQLSELKSQLKAIGFSSRAISAAFKNIRAMPANPESEPEEN